MLREDLECLTGRLIQGPLTPIVYQLLKDSPYKEELRYTLSTRGREMDVDEQNTDTASTEITNSRPSLAEWISKHGKPISL